MTAETAKALTLDNQQLVLARQVGAAFQQAATLAQPPTLLVAMSKLLLIHHLPLPLQEQAAALMAPQAPQQAQKKQQRERQKAQPLMVHVAALLVSQHPLELLEQQEKRRLDRQVAPTLGRIAAQQTQKAQQAMIHMETVETQRDAIVTSTSTKKD